MIEDAVELGDPFASVCAPAQQVLMAAEPIAAYNT